MNEKLRFALRNSNKNLTVLGKSKPSCKAIPHWFKL